jgi:hypothetical protein
MTYRVSFAFWLTNGCAMTGILSDMMGCVCLSSKALVNRKGYRRMNKFCNIMSRAEEQGEKGRKERVKRWEREKRRATMYTVKIKSRELPRSSPGRGPHFPTNCTPSAPMR